MVLLKLALSNFLVHKVRVALTVAAIALSVSLVVSVTSGYASVEGAVFKYLGQFLGTTDVQVGRNPDGPIAASLLDELRKDPDVRKVDGRCEVSMLVDRGSLPPPGEKITARPASVVGIRRPEDKSSDFLRMTSGEWFNTARGNVAVIDQAISERLKVQVGDEVVLPGSAEVTEAPETAPSTQPVVPQGLRLRIVGIVHKPAIVAMAYQSMYVPIETIQEYTNRQGQLSRILVDTRPDTDTAFEKRWTPKLKALDRHLVIRTARQTRREMDRNLEGVNALSYLGGTVSMLAATFIVFSALSMGVSERQRTLAMLRAVGTQRGQVARLVIMEGLALAVLGVVIGVPLGWAWIRILAAMFSDVFVAGVVPSWGGILLGSLGSIVAALAASLLPAWNATRVSPLEAMNPQATPPSSGLPWVSAVFGLLLISVDPFLLFGPIQRIAAAFGAADPVQTGRDVQFVAHFGIGLPCLMVGFFLLSPTFVWIIERLLGRLVAAMFGLRYALLRQQLTSGVWRVAGTCSALMVGLAVLVVMQTNGHTMLHGWRLPDKFPDVFISTGFRGGLTWDEQTKLAEVPGIRKGEIMPIGIASPQFGSNMFGLSVAALLPDATMFIAVPPDKAFKMMELEFKEGNAEQAAALLAKGDHIVVTEEFRNLKNLGLGKKMELKTSQGTREFTIAGVVWSPGIDVMVSMFDVGRQFEQRTAASVFGSVEDGRKYFGIEQIMLFAANLDHFVEREEILKRVQKELGKEGMSVGDVRHIKANIQDGFSRILLLASTVAFAAMAVASLGVTNTIMASIRSRRWQFGILRSIGVTRSQLLRVVLAEAFLIGLAGCGLGLGAGFLMTLDANQLSAVLVGYHPPISVPWPIIWIGTGIVMAISLLASLWPAASVANREPLELLQAGRAAS